MTVYLLHIYPPLKHARHYIGFTTDDTPDRTNRRIVQHIKGLKKSSPLIRAAIAQGSKLKVAYIWVGADRNFERKLKNRADATRWCPCCGQGGRVPQP